MVIQVNIIIMFSGSQVQQTLVISAKK